MTDAIDELSDDEPTVTRSPCPTKDLGDYRKTTAVTTAGRVIDLDHLMIYGEERKDVPFPVKYHGDGLRSEGIDPREYPDWEQGLTPPMPVRRTTTFHREPQIMRVYEVIVGNVGSVYQGRSRTTALATYESYVEISKEHVGARCYGEDVTLLRRWRDRAGAHGSSVRRVTQAGLAASSPIS